MMRISFAILCILLLSSCVYYGTSRDVDLSNNNSATCTKGSTKQNKECHAELRKLEEAIKERTK
ncbi:hypothetical protein [Thalassotalea atypica]|uniref:hypothetical protein n=1 Tax=Thalassotalea atypica TaxID=2054316 RepID=UPI002572A519|nr:hypothetical protein [Thalassotalea atypica]